MIGLLTDNPAALSIQRWVLPRHHHWATERFKSVAKDVALIPHQVQAVTWLAWRRDQGIVETQHTGQQSFFDIAV